MAFVLVFTCNNATFQPLMALADTAEGLSPVEEVAPGDGSVDVQEPEADTPPNKGAGDVAEGDRDDEVTTDEAMQEEELPPAPEPVEGEVVEEDSVEAPAGESVQSIVAGAPRDAGAHDVTGDTEQLSLGIGSFSWKDAAGSYAAIEQDGLGGYQLPKPFEGIKGLRLVLDFAVLKDDETRTIKPGDTFSFSLGQKNPEGLPYFTLADTAAPQDIKFSGDLVATYEIKDGILKVTFSENVDFSKGYSKIGGGISLNLELNERAFGIEDETGIDLVLQDIGHPTQIIVPPKSSVVDGVEKEGVYDPETRSIIWTIRAGTASPGLDMGGMKIVDTFDANVLEFTSASTTGADGVAVDITDAVERADGLCAYTFLAGALAPQTVQVVTRVKDAALPATGVSKIGNVVALEEGSSPYDPGEHANASTTTPVPGMGLQKNGEQIDGNRMQWTIVVNDAEDAWLWNAVVTDELSASLAYIDGSLKIDGTEVPVNVSTQSSDYATLVGNADDSHTLAIHFVDTEAAEHGGNPIISKRHVITFETSLTDKTVVEDAQITNTATLNGSWPNGTGGPGVAYNHEMGIDATYNYAFVKKDGSVDERTGIITWTVSPQTRLGSFETATLVDVVDASDQKYVEGSIELEYKGDSFNQQELIDGNWLEVEGAGTTDDPTTLTLTLPKDYFPVLADVHITYQTQATAGFLDGTHGESHTYGNTVDLAVQTTDGPFEYSAKAEVPLANDLIGKAAEYEYDDASGKGRLRYTLTVNASKMELHDVVVTDDLSQLRAVYHKNDGTTIGIPAAAWDLESFTIKDGSGALVSVAEVGSFKVELGAITDTYTIDLYLTLTDEAKQTYLLDSGSGFIRTANEATIDGTCTGGAIERKAVHVTTPEGGDIANELVDKSSQLNKATGAIRWRVDVNPQGALLKNATVKDVLNKSLQLDTLTVKLYESKHDTDGRISQDDPASGWTEVPDTSFTVEPGDDASSVLRVKLPDGNKAYTLVYETAITEAVNAGYVQNRATLVNDDTEKADGSHSQELNDDSWGYLERTASYKFMKMDSLGGSAQPLGLDVKFGLFTDKDCKNQIKSVTANGRGEFGFYGLGPGATYWYKELVAPDGYVLDTTAHKLEVPVGVFGVQPDVITVTNERVKATGSVKIAKEFESNAADTVSFDREAHFQLVLRPLGSTSGKAVGVILTGADGTYQYGGTTSVDAATDLVAKAPSGSNSATLSLSELPWGDYELRETSTAAGYALPSAAKKFTVEKDGTVSFGESASASVVVENVKTHITLEKRLDGKQDAVEGARFSIMDATGTNVVTSLFTGDAYTWVPDGAPWEIVGLPAGSYVLRETSPANSLEIAQLADAPFTIAADGSLKLDKSVAHVTAEGNAIVADNVPCALVKVEKRDQFGQVVKGATLQLEKKVGGLWTNVGGLRTTSETVLEFDGLERGTDYRLSEVSTPQGYLTAQSIEFSIDVYGTVQGVKLNDPAGTSAAYGNAWSNGAFTLRDERIMGHAQFKKVVEGSSDTPLAGAAFDLYRVDSGSSGTKMNGNIPFVSNAQGLVTTIGSSLSEGLEPGTYYFVETSAPAGFKFDPASAAKSEQFTVAADGSNRYTEVGGFTPKRNVIDLASIANTPLSASVLVHKKAEDGTALAGAKFELAGKNADGAAVTFGATTDADGAARFEGVPAGNYTVKETKPPAGYQLSDAVLSVTVEQDAAGRTYDLNADAPLINEQTSITVAKVDENGDALAGAEFELEGIFANGATTPLVWTSGAGAETIKGKLVVSNVYQLTERAAPQHYVVASEPSEIKLDETGALYERALGTTSWQAVNANTLTVANDPVRGQAEVTKTVVGGDGTVAGVEFDLFKQDVSPDGGDLAIALGCTTGARGTWGTADQTALNPDTGEPLSAGLAAGSYFIVETKATPDTELDVSPRAFTIADSDHFATTHVAVQVPLENKAFAASLELVKLDGTTDDPLAGSKFELTYVPEGGGAEQTLAVPVTGEPGHFRLNDLKKGSYTLRETAVPDGYQEPFEATFVLTDAHNGKTVTVCDSAANAVAITKTAGTWTEEGVTNTRVLGSLKLTKVGEQNDPLGGAVFTLEKSEAGAWGVVGTYTTASDGTIIVSDLAWGTYRLAETKAADGYHPGDNIEPVEFQVGPASGTEVKLVWDRGAISNERTDIAIEKVNDAGASERLDGAVLVLSGRFADGTTEKRWTSSKEVAEEFTGLFVVGETYTLTEAERLAGHLSLLGPLTFTLNAAGQVVLGANPAYDDGSLAASLSVDGRLLSVCNVEVLGVAMLTKMDVDAGVPLDGAVFSLYDDAGSLVRAGLTTGFAYTASDWLAEPAAVGTLTVSGLDLGSYYFQETAAEGYQVSDTTYEFVIDEDNATKTPSCDVGVVANRQTELSFTKVGLCAEACSDPALGAEAPDATLPLAGAVFTAYRDAACTQVAASGMSDATGRVSFKKLPAATYWVKETTTPVGHVPSTTVYVATFEKGGQLASFVKKGAPDVAVDTVVNDVYRTDIRIKKVSETDEGKVLPNSTYGLYKRVAAQGGELVRARASLLAVDAPFEPMLQLVAKATTGEDGYLVFEGVLMDQEYVIQELVAPDGSLVSENPISIEFAMDADGTPKIVKFDDGSGTAEVDAQGNIVWKEPQVTVLFYKKGPEGNLLAGAQLQVVDQNGTIVVAPWASAASEGRAVEGILVAGETYRLQETEAPAGYLLANDVEFIVDNPKVAPDEHHTQLVEMVDERIPSPAKETPVAKRPTARTGDPWTQAVPLVVGSALLAVCIAGASILRHRRRVSPHP